MDLKNVSKIDQKYKDIVFGFLNKIQSTLPKDNPYYNIVPLISHLILLYYYHTFESLILSNEQQEIFKNLFDTNNKKIINNAWNLIFRASRDGFKREQFIKKVHGKPHIIVLVHAEQDDIFGVYTSTGWSEPAPESQYSEDKHAFVFQLKSSKSMEPPFICNVKQDDKSLSQSIGYAPFAYGMVGDTWAFYICVFKHKRADKETVRRQKPSNFQNASKWGQEAQFYDLIEIEAFQML